MKMTMFARATRTLILTAYHRNGDT